MRCDTSPRIPSTNSKNQQFANFCRFLSCRQRQPCSNTAQLNRRRQGREMTMKHREPNGLLFESLEPRLLMAGDFGTVHDVSMLSDVAVLSGLQNYADLHRLVGTHVVTAMQHPRIGLDLTIELNKKQDELLVINDKSGSILDRYSLESNRPITIQGTQFADTFNLMLDPAGSNLPQITIAGGQGNDTLNGPTGGADWALTNSGKGYVGDISFKNIESLDARGSGSDTLEGPIKGATWAVDGDGNGSLLSTGFTGFGKLQGSDHGPDIFLIEPKGGSQAGGALNHGDFQIDGGKGGNDKVIIEGNNFLSAQFNKRETGAGELTLDGLHLQYSNIEKANLQALDSTQAVVQDFTYTATSSNDSLTVSNDAADSSQISVIGKAAGDSDTFAKPTGSLTISAPGTSSSVTVQNITLPGANFTVTAGTPGVGTSPIDDSATTSITVATNDTVDTAKSGGQGGNITLQANSIEVQSGASLSDVNSATGSTGGTITLSADNQRLATGYFIDQANDLTARNATITVDSGATLHGGNVILQAKAGDQSLSGDMNDLATGIPENVGFQELQGLQSLLNIPVSILLKNSNADINISGATVSATGSVSIDSNAQADGTGTGTYWLNRSSVGGALTFVYIQTEASATVELSGSNVSAQTGDASITTEGTTNATGISRVSQNTGQQFSPTNPQNIQASVAVGRTTLTSTIDIDAQTTVEAGTGNITITATGNNTNEPGAETESYKDGLAGVTLGLALSNSTVKVTSLGHIEDSGGRSVHDQQAEFNPFQSINSTDNTIAVENTAGYATGQAVIYNANLGGAVGGLKDQQTYYVIVVDATHFELAASRANAFAGTAIQLQAQPMMQDSAGTTYAFDQVDESENALIFDYNPGLQAGQQLYYVPAAGQNIDGLAAKNTANPTTLYTVAAVTTNPSSPSQYLVTLKNSAGSPVTLSAAPELVGIDGAVIPFSIASSAIQFSSAQPSITNGQPFTYRAGLGTNMPTLTDGQTYYMVKDPTDTTGTVFRLSATQAGANSSDGYSNAIALDHVNTNVTTGSLQWLQVVNPGGVSITATLTSTEEADTKSGQGGEPETSDLAGKGELLPSALTIFKNLGSVGTKDSDGNVLNAMDSRINANQPAGSGSNEIGSGVATVAFVDTVNNVSVVLGNTVESASGLTVNASLTHSIQTQAEGVKSPSQTNNTDATFGGAATVGMAYDSATVTVEPDAHLDASGAMSLNASVTYPFLAPLDSPDDFFSYVLNQLETNPQSTISGFLGNVFLLKQDLVNSWARSVDNDTNSTASIAGAVDYQYHNTTATVDVGGGVQINQNPAYASKNQSVNLDAETHVDMVNVGGIFDYDLSPEGLIKSARLGPTNSIQPWGAQGGKLGIGGAFRMVDFNTTTHAIIEGQDTAGKATTITATDGLGLNSNNDGFVLGVVQSGSSAGKVAISGSAAFNRITTSTISAIESGANVTADSVGANSTERTVMPTYAGDIAKGQNLGFGSSLVYNEINNTTDSYIGDITGVSTKPSTYNVGGLSLSSDAAADYFGFALAAAKADADNTAAGGSSDSSNFRSIPINPFTGKPMIDPPPEQKSGSYGVAVSGDVVYNQVTASTEAVIDDTGSITTTGGTSLTTDDSTQLIGAAGAVAIASGNKASAGLAGSFAENQWNSTTAAELNRVGLHSNDSSLTLQATSEGMSTAAAAGGSGGINHADGSAEIAGSVAINIGTPQTIARIDGATVTTGGDVTLGATDQERLYALAAAASFGGKQGLGASSAVNLTDWTSPVDGKSYWETVDAQIVNSTITQSGLGSISLTAQLEDPSSTDPRLVAVAGSLGAGQSVGVSGTVAVNDLGVVSGNAVEASITGSSITGGNGDGSSLTLAASDDQTIITIGGEVAVVSGKSGTFAFGAGVADTESSLPVKAFIDSSSINVAALSLDASIAGTTTSTSAGLVVAQDAPAVAGSSGVNVNSDRAFAYIDGLSGSQTIQVARTVSVTAENHGTLAAAAGDIVAGSSTGGAALALNDLTQSTAAYVGAAPLTLGGNLTVAATNDGKVVSAAVGAVGGSNFALGGSVAFTWSNTSTNAYVSGATVSTPASVKIAAEAAVTFVTAAGTLAVVAGSDEAAGAVGVSNATLSLGNSTLAYAGSGSIDFGGANSPEDVKIGSGGSLSDDSTFTGLSITALTDDDITTASGGGALTSGSVGVAGSVNVTLVSNTTRATAEGSLVIPGHQSATNINVLAYDGGSLKTGAGELAGADTAAIGAAVDTIQLTKQTEGRFESNGTVGISGNMAVQALSNEDLQSVAAGFSLSPQFAIAGAASAYVLDLTTWSSIGDDNGDKPQITAGGSVVLSSQDTTDINQIPGGIDAGNVGVGATAGVVDIKGKWVDAEVADGVGITAHADASQAAIEAATGEFAVNYTDPTNEPGDVQPPNVSVDMGKQTGDPNAPALTDGGLSKTRSAPPVFDSTRGISVSAINTGNVLAVAGSASLSGEGGAALNADVDAINMTTNTRVLGAATLTSGGDVVLATGADLHKLGVTGNLTISGGVAGALGADVTLASMNTGTLLNSNNDGTATHISAGPTGNVIVNAQAEEDFLVVTAGVGASGQAGFDSGATVFKVNNTTLVGNSFGAFNITAGNNILLDAADDTTVAGITGQVAVGIVGGSFGGSTVVTLIDKNTNTIIASGSSLDAKANGTTKMTVLDGTVNDAKTGLDEQMAQGVAIQATSSENVEAISVAGAGGTYFGGAAGANYTAIASNTGATVGAVEINTDHDGSVAQDVNIGAGNNVNVLSAGGGLGLGAGGIGAGVDVGTIRNNTNAAVDSGSTLDAAGDVNVTSTGLTDLNSYAMSVGGGAVGIAGSVSVWTLGTGVDSSYTDTNSANDALTFRSGNGANNVGQAADSQTNRTDVTGVLGQYSNVGGVGSDQVSTTMSGASSDYSAAQPNGAVSATLASKDTSGVSSSISSGDTINSSNLNVGATTVVVPKQISGNAAVGLASVGAGVNILNRGDNTAATMDGHANVSNQVQVTGLSESTVTSDSFGGSAGIASGGAQVARVTDNSSVSATVGPEATVSGAPGELHVGAGTVDNITVNVMGLTVGAIEGGYGSSQISITGGTTAVLGGTSLSAGSVSVSADAEITADPTSKASGGGLLAGAIGNVSQLNIGETVAASVGDGPALQVTTPGGVDVDASENIQGTATANGFSEGVVVSAGYSKADVEDTSTVSASIGAETTVNAGSVTVQTATLNLVTANGTANAGATLLGGGIGVLANASVTNTESAYILGDVTSSGDIQVLVNDAVNNPKANAHGEVIQGLVDVGYSTATAQNNTKLQAYIDQGIVKTTGSGDITVAASEGAASSPTGPEAIATDSQGVYSGGDNYQSQATTTNNVEVDAFIGNPSGEGGATSAVVDAAGALSVAALSSTVSEPQAQINHNDSAVAVSEANATANATKTTTAYIGGEDERGAAKASAGGALSVLATSQEDLSPLAEGYDGGGLSATGRANTTVNLTRSTSVDIGTGATVTAAGSLDLDAETNTTSSGSLTDNQGHGAYSAVFHANAVQGTARPISTFNITGGTSVVVDGALTAPTMSLRAHTLYDIDVSAFGWCTSGEGTTSLTSQAYVKSTDDTVVQFTDQGSADAAQSITLYAGYTGSSVNTLTKLHYSEFIQPSPDFETKAASILNGTASVLNNNDGNAVTSPDVMSTVDANGNPTSNWEATDGDNNHVSWGTHDLNPANNITARNDFGSGVGSSQDTADGGGAAQLARFHWIVQGDSDAQQSDQQDDWIESSRVPHLLAFTDVPRVHWAHQ
jgi:hypothetical protein